MYKTIRHGENSLQYTILPQNDDFRIEGKLSSAGSGSSTTAGRKSKAKRPKRRSFFAYLGLIFVCTVIIGAVLIPFLVSAECLPSPTEWFLKTKAALIKSGGGGDSKASGNEHNGRTPNNGNGINVGKTVKIINKDGVEKIIMKLNKTETSENHETLLQHVNKTFETSSNISNLNETQKLAAGSAAEKTIVQQMKTEHGSAKETETDIQQRNERNGTATTLSDTNDSVLVKSSSNANTKPITQTENFVAEVRFDDAHSVGEAAATSDQLSAISPTIVVTTLRGGGHRPPQQQQINSNSNNNFEINNNNNEPLPIKQYVTAPIIRPTSSFSSSSVNSPRAPPNANQNSINNSNSNNSGAPPALPTILTRIIQVPLLKSAAKKPIMPPVLVKTNSLLSSATAYKTNNNGAYSIGSDLPAASYSSSDVVDDKSNVVGVAAAALPNAEQPPKNSDWVHSHWPYIDPTTYFQWTGYKAEDSVLLPALLGFALIGMILVITVCLVARNKRTIVSSVRKRNRNDIEETGAEDNATLLTNLSDED